MSRFLADSLQTKEPILKHAINNLEKDNGYPKADIRLSVEIMDQARKKLKQLELDPNDTTNEELYYFLQEKVKVDDAKIVTALRSMAAHNVSAEGDVVDGMIFALKHMSDSKNCYAVKQASIKKLLRKSPPKKTMKQLGYRSLDSLLKHESPILIVAAARLIEANNWNKQFIDSYKSLSSRDFENRQISFLEFSKAKARTLAEKIVSDKKNNIISLKEFGALVFLPLPKDMPSGTVLASIGIALHELNEIRACNTYLKLCQVRNDFGILVQSIASSELQLNTKMLDSPLPWRIVQRYLALRSKLTDSVTDTYLQQEDIAWHPIESALATIDHSLSFWKDSSHLAVIEARQPVSLNILDAAINCCNKLPFEKRINSYFQGSLIQELLLKYFNPEFIEESLLRELQPKLVKVKAES